MKRFPFYPQMLFWTPRPTENAWRRSGLRLSTCPPCTWRSRLSGLCTVQDGRRASWWISVTVWDVKEKLCYIRFDLDTELKSTTESSDKNQTYMLFDGNTITVDAERFRCTIIVPAFFHLDTASGIHDTSFRSATWTSARSRALMSWFQVARTMLQRIVERMTKELTLLSPPTLL